MGIDGIRPPNEGFSLESARNEIKVETGNETQKTIDDLKNLKQEVELHQHSQLASARLEPPKDSFRYTQMNVILERAAQQIQNQLQTIREMPTTQLDSMTRNPKL
jgi:hypothetical protein